MKNLKLTSLSVLSVLLVAACAKTSGGSGGPVSASLDMPPAENAGTASNYSLNGKWVGEGKMKPSSIAEFRYNDNYRLSPSNEKIDCSLKLTIQETDKQIRFTYEDFDAAIATRWYNPYPDTRVDQFELVNGRYDGKGYLRRDDYEGKPHFEYTMSSGFWNSVYEVTSGGRDYGTGKIILQPQGDGTLKGSIEITSSGMSARIYLAYCHDMVFRRQ